MLAAVYMELSSEWYGGLLAVAATPLPLGSIPDLKGFVDNEPTTDSAGTDCPFCLLRAEKGAVVSGGGESARGGGESARGGGESARGGDG